LLRRTQDQCACCHRGRQGCRQSCRSGNRKIILGHSERSAAAESRSDACALWYGPYSISARARKPSYFSSKIQSGEVKGSRERPSGMGVNAASESIKQGRQFESGRAPHFLKFTSCNDMSLPTTIKGSEKIAPPSGRASLCLEDGKTPIEQLCWKWITRR